MTSRQRLDQELLSVFGGDIRLVGKWERVPALFRNAEQLAERLAAPKSALLCCPDIFAVLSLVNYWPHLDEV